MWRMAWRNLWRNRTRSVIGCSAIALTFAMMLIVFGIQESEYDKMLQAAARTAGGDVLVHQKGYWADPSVTRLVPDGAARLVELGALPGVEAVMPRVLVGALVSSARGNAGVQLRGIDPAREVALQDLSPRVEGQFLDGPTRRGRHPMVLGSGVVETLKLALGDRLVLTATAPDGQVRRALFELQGILETGVGPLDDGAAYTTVAGAQDALGLGDRLTQIGLLVEEGSDTESARHGVAAALGDPGLEVLTWQQAMPDMLAFVEIDRTMGTFMMYVIMLVVAFGIMNTFMMVVLERVREFGLLAALGTSPRGIGLMVLMETLMMAILALGLGTLLALWGHHWFATEGWDLAAWVEGGYELNGVMIEDFIVRSRMDLGRWIQGGIGVLCLVLASGLYPAWRATRLLPTEAMRTYE